MHHHPMDRLAQTTVGHHQPKYSVKALEQHRKISFKGSQGHVSLGMLAQNIVAEVLEVSQKAGVVNTKLMSPVKHILTVRRH
jgi:hypothetical protein